MSDRTEWLEWRRNGIGASDVAGILGLSPWATPWTVWADKARLTPLDDGDAPWLEFGRRAEPMIADWFHDRTDLHVVSLQLQCIHKTLPHHRCTIDGLVTESPPPPVLRTRDDVLGWFESKWDTRHTPAEWAEKVPDHYACQAAWITHVTGLASGWFAVLHGGRAPTLGVYEHTPSPEDVAYVVDHVERFWRDHVLTGTPPDVDGNPHTTDAIKHAYPNGHGQLEASDDLEQTVREIDRVKTWLRMERNRVDMLENQVRVALGRAAADELTYGTDTKGQPVVLASWREHDRRDVDTAAVRRDHGDRYDTCTTVRTLRTHIPKPKKAG